MILPTDAPRKVAPATTTAASIARDFKEATITCSAKTPVGVTTDKSAVTAVKIATKKISLKETFMCSTDELYRCLTEENVRSTDWLLIWACVEGAKVVLFSSWLAKLGATLGNNWSYLTTAVANQNKLAAKAKKRKTAG